MEKDFQTRLKEYRQHQQLSIAKISAKHKIPSATWEGWEYRGKEPRDFQTASKMHRILANFERSIKKDNPKS